MSNFKKSIDINGKTFTHYSLCNKRYDNYVTIGGITYYHIND